MWRWVIEERGSAQSSQGRLPGETGKAFLPGDNKVLAGEKKKWQDLGVRRGEGPGAPGRGEHSGGGWDLRGRPLWEVLSGGAR